MAPNIATKKHYLCNAIGKLVANVVLKMSAKPTDMNKIKQVIRLYKDSKDGKVKMSNRKIAESLGLYKGTVNKYVKAAEHDTLSLDALLKLEPQELEHRLNGGTAAYSDKRFEDFSTRLEYFVHELDRKHVTMQQLWEEYRSEVPDGYGYTQFCFHISQHKAAVKPSMVLREDREGGREMFVDFAGDTMQIVDPETGEVTDLQVFVACMPASDYGFAMAVPSQKIEDFLYAMECALRFFGGAPAIVVTDNLKSAVIKSDRYQPTINIMMEQFANHHGFTVIPTRAAKPKDKALVEDHVRLVYRRVYAPLRNRQFFSIEELNKAILELMHKHNQKRMQQYQQTREERFLALDQPKLTPLNPQDFEVVSETKLIVGSDCYVYFGRDKHYYSVPYKHIGKRVTFAYTNSKVDIFLDGVKIANYIRNRKPGGHTKTDSHFPSYFNDYQQLSPQKYEERASRISSSLAKVVQNIFSTPRAIACPEDYYRSCDGLIHLSKGTDIACFEMACDIALEYNKCNYPFIKNLVESRCNGFFSTPSSTKDISPKNDDLRGKSYYQ